MSTEHCIRLLKRLGSQVVVESLLKGEYNRDKLQRITAIFSHGRRDVPDSVILSKSFFSLPNRSIGAICSQLLNGGHLWEEVKSPPLSHESDAKLLSCCHLTQDFEASKSTFWLLYNRFAGRRGPKSTEHQYENRLRCSKIRGQVVTDKFFCRAA